MSEGYRESILDNGVRVVTEAMPRLETAAIGLWIDVGSRHERAEVNGVAHMLEHMAFKGTARRSARQIAEQIEDVGGSLNAYTSREHTAYYARLLADDIDLAGDILGDIVRNSTFDEVELEKERHVILQEIGEVEDTPSDLVFDILQEVAYPDQAIGRSILGPEDIVGRMPRRALFDYVGEHYHADRIVLSASGKVRHDHVVALAGQVFDGMGRGAASAPEKARYAGGVRMVERDLEQVHVCLATDAFAYTDPDLYALQVFSAALGGGMSSRLFQKIREDMGLCYSIFSFTSLHNDSGMMGVYAGTGEADVERLLPAIADEIRSMVKSLDAVELQRAKAQMKAGLLMGLEGCFAVCEDMARQHLCFGDRLSAAQVAAKIEAVDMEAIERVGQRLFGSNPVAALAAIGPEKGLPRIGIDGLITVN
ncbi:MAG: insulinase family protein [Geminicoccaceae bacterium]|nr:insulinase family protein [Geminicoccaceae bacterium]MCB9944839.1 insulinase family protein [Geminicoccaceae bacterium]